MNTRKAINNLKRFTRRLVKDGVATRSDWKEWKHVQKNIAFMEKCFEYTRLDGMPSVVDLLSPDFNQSESLILLNYGDLAHNTLFRFEDKGWTETLRHCRGTVFDRTSKLVGLAFPKFFNKGEHPETRNLPIDVPIEVTLKHDGWLGIIFWHNGKLMIITRGSFDYEKMAIFRAMLGKYVQDNNWEEVFPKHLTLLVEMIHPETEVHLNYEGQEKFIIIGAFDTRSSKNYYDFTHPELTTLGQTLGLEVTELLQFNSIEELTAFVENPNTTGIEGGVLRLPDGRRVKFKCIWYIEKMKAAKLSYSWLMYRIVDGNVEKKILEMPEEIIEQARAMLADVLKVKEITGETDFKRKKAQRDYLYALYNRYPELDEDRTYKTHQTVCQKLVRHLNAD